MTFGPVDLVRLRRAGLRFVALALLGAAAAGFGYRLADIEGEGHRRVLAEQRELAERGRADVDFADIAADVERYRELVARGHIGPERRLDWMERIAEVRQARRLFEFRYEFAPQRALGELPQGKVADGFEFMASAMKLQMPLLHEDDLLGFLDDLARTVPALLQVRECRIGRLAQGAASIAGPAPRLTADCSIDWITLRQKT